MLLSHKTCTEETAGCLEMVVCGMELNSSILGELRLKNLTSGRHGKETLQALQKIRNPNPCASYNSHFRSAVRAKALEGS